MEIYLDGGQIDVSSDIEIRFFSALIKHAVCKSVGSAADAPYDYVILTTKALPDIIKTPTILAPLLTAPYIDKYPQPVYVILQNGLNVEVDLYHAIKALAQGDPKIIGTSLYIGTNLLAPDVVEHNGFVRSFILIGNYAVLIATFL